MPASDGIVLTADLAEEGVVDRVTEAVKECEAVVHLAANLSMAPDEKVLRDNCDGTLHMVQIANRLHVRTFLYLSSVPVIGKPVHTPIREDHPVSPRTLYHMSKLMGEFIVKELCNQEMNRLILRIASPVGVGMSRKNYLSFLLDRFLREEPVELYGAGKRIQNYLDVRDIAEALRCALKKSVSDTMVLSGTSISNRDLAILCKKMTGSSSEIIRGKHPDPEENDQWILDAGRARNILGFLPQYSLEETIRWICESGEA